MANTPNYPTIPNPDANVQSLQQAVLAIKRVLEMLTNTDTSSQQANKKQVYLCHCFVQMEQPTANNRGDIWLCTGTNYSFSIWDGTVWLKIVDMSNVSVNITDAINKTLARTR